MDETSGVPNHEFTQFHLTKNLASFARYHLPFGVIAIQVDRLQRFRAAYGRPAEDAIVSMVAQTLKNAFRPTDFLGRWADDQFLAILINCGEHGVEKTWERVQKMVTCAGLRWWSDELLVTTSVGYATVQTEDTHRHALKPGAKFPERNFRQTGSRKRSHLASEPAASHHHHQEKRRTWRTPWGRLEGSLCRLRNRDDGALHCALAAEHQQTY
jgi:diguanylate cyclase (GGDEF)-like protein